MFLLGQDKVIRRSKERYVGAKRRRDASASPASSCCHFAGRGRIRRRGWRRGAESNRRIEVLQTSALPLGYRAVHSRVAATLSPRARALSSATLGLCSRDVGARSGLTRKPLTAEPAETAERSMILNLGGLCELGGFGKRLERETGFEPATSTLARSHSTAELLPLG